MILFGESAKYIEKQNLKSGAILDLTAAEILSKRGIDVGLNDFSPIVQNITEFFRAQNEYIELGRSGLYETQLKKGAVCITDYIGKKSYNGAYTYENAEGTRFLVYPVNAYKADINFYKNYARQQEVIDLLPWLQGRKVEAYSPKHPGLYIFCKRGKNSMSVGLWNLFPDKIDKPAIFLDKEYSDINFLNCKGELLENKVTLSALNAFEFAAFEVID